MVCGESNKAENWIALISAEAFAVLTASRSEQSPATQAGLFRSSILVTISVTVTIVVGSDAWLFPVLLSPPPDTVTTLVTEAGAPAETLTVNVITG